MLLLSEALKISCTGGCGADQISAKAVPERPGHGSIQSIPLQAKAAVASSPLCHQCAMDLFIPRSWKLEGILVPSITRPCCYSLNDGPYVGQYPGISSGGGGHRRCSCGIWPLPWLDLGHGLPDSGSSFIVQAVLVRTVPTVGMKIILTSTDINSQ